MRRIVQGSAPAVTQLLTRSQGGGVINTAYIERLNATFRQRLACLARRSLAQQQATLTAGMYVVGCFYNFCVNMKACVCASGLRNDAIAGCNGPQRWRPKLTDHCWTPGTAHVQGAATTLDATATPRSTVKTDKSARRQVVLMTSRLSAVVPLGLFGQKLWFEEKNCGWGYRVVVLLIWQQT